MSEHYRDAELAARGSHADADGNRLRITAKGRQGQITDAYGNTEYFDLRDDNKRAKFVDLANGTKPQNRAYYFGQGDGYRGQEDTSWVDALVARDQGRHNPRYDSDDNGIGIIGGGGGRIGNAYGGGIAGNGVGKLISRLVGDDEPSQAQQQWENDHKRSALIERNAEAKRLQAEARHKIEGQDDFTGAQASGAARDQFTRAATVQEGLAEFKRGPEPDIAQQVQDGLKEFRDAKIKAWGPGN
jgi:hypothetical protein